MLTGMTISIASGLTVLNLHFKRRKCPSTRWRLKLVTARRFRIMAIPSFIMAGGYSDPRRRGKTNDRVLRFPDGHWHGGLAPSLVAPGACPAGVRRDRAPSNTGGETSARSSAGNVRPAIRCASATGIVVE